ncbi:site-specific DNA-methyltransferase [Bacillus zhangzhouensis]|uniref:site-specific DNA-methyltransferase n=1 Tax=Bacillus zhangzhouensis TaxID=1178540 RepID=UPI0020C0A8F9|nr:site-specific DNA-methyltransferase [Bacillus zhangzhouensis]
MAFIENKIMEINDPELRKVITHEIKKLKETINFGLVFEQHIPEIIPIYNAKVRARSFVVLKKSLNEGKIQEIYKVKRIRNNYVELQSELDKSLSKQQIDDLVVIKKFGDPIYPALVPVDYVNNQTDFSHVLIEADNFHALQLLEYIYPQKVDCIYIDPPYNTGSKDWKYNNDFVDEKDSYRHSKWLSFMKKRLLLAKNLLTDDGVLIVAIDDYEVAHLAVLLEEIYPGYNSDIVIVNHHPQGAGGDNISRTHEYALFLTPKGMNLLKGKKEEDVIEEWSLSRSGRDRRNFRRGRPNSFYAIHVDPETLEIKGVGPKLDKEEEYPTEDTPEGYKRIYPVSKKDGSERVWRYERTSMLDKIDQGKIKCTPNYSLKLIKKSATKYKPVFSNWYGSRYNAGPNGTELLTRIFGQSIDFPYPKSLYTVYDALEAVLQNKKDALVLDFFAGSGTTLNALSLLNYSDGGNRQCILVTNNEVSEEEGRALDKLGLFQGNPSREEHGICKTVTFPRCKYILNGEREDGSQLEGKYVTSVKQIVEKPRKFKHLNFVDGKTLNGTSKKQLVSLIDGIPQSKINAASDYFIDSKYNASILFDDSKVEEFLEGHNEMQHISNIYVVSTKKNVFTEVKKSLSDMLGPIIVQEDQELPLSSGFNESLAYFKLDFLDPNEVALGKQFDKILPILWMDSGSKGDIQSILSSDLEDQPYMIHKGSGFAVLFEETKFREFHSLVNKNDDITNVYIITNSEDAFFEMKSEFINKKMKRLYSDYLRNFEINRHWR